ncbi:MULTISPECIES: excisionase [unclassified Luteibacter]|uniref:excisionase n=1 Tax=Luteibacter sp. PvP019 TaxID=3156436 RepID=UPI0033986D2C
MMRYITIAKFAAESGYSEDAVRAKIKNGVWLEGLVWKKAPDGRVLIIPEGYERWAEGQTVSDLQRKAA